MSRLPAPSRRDHHGGGQGVPVGTAVRGRRQAAPPDLAAGQVRCPVCRNGTALTSGGVLRRHRDLFGDPCINRGSGQPSGIEAPPVEVPLPPESRFPERTPTNEPERPASRLDAGSECRECGKWLPGERSLCGRCSILAKRVRR